MHGLLWQGLVSKVLPDKAALMQHVMAVAPSIAQKSPLAVTGTKRVLLHARQVQHLQ